eukprot:5428162-Prymnesium_polylepis.2
MVTIGSHIDVDDSVDARAPHPRGSAPPPLCSRARHADIANKVPFLHILGPAPKCSGAHDCTCSTVIAVE